MPDDTFVIGSIKKGTDEVRVAINEYKGVKYCDVRKWYTPRGGGEHKPTKDGVTFSLAHIRTMRELLEEAEQLARDRGWMPER